MTQITWKAVCNVLEDGTTFSQDTHGIDELLGPQECREWPDLRDVRNFHQGAIHHLIIEEQELRSEVSFLRWVDSQPLGVFGPPSPGVSMPLALSFVLVQWWHQQGRVQYLWRHAEDWFRQYKPE